MRVVRISEAVAVVLDDIAAARCVYEHRYPREFGAHFVEVLTGGSWVTVADWPVVSPTWGDTDAVKARYAEAYQAAEVEAQVAFGLLLAAMEKD